MFFKNVCVRSLLQTKPNELSRGVLWVGEGLEHFVNTRYIYSHINLILIKSPYKWCRTLNILCHTSSIFIPLPHPHPTIILSDLQILTIRNKFFKIDNETRRMTDWRWFQLNEEEESSWEESRKRLKVQTKIWKKINSKTVKGQRENKDRIVHRRKKRKKIEKGF